MLTPNASRLTSVRRATADDAALLASIGASTFTDTFAADNDPRDMAMYVEKAFGEAVQRAELEESRHAVFIAERDGEAAGYAMLREGPAPEFVRDRDTIEIVRLYSTKRFIGAGVGAALMQRCLDEATARGRSTVWLGVWEHNARAIAFYRRWGFEDLGSHTFVLGRDRQTDRVMARRVTEA